MEMNHHYLITNEDLKKLQQKNLEMAKYFIQFCKENSINVFLCGGACLGAVRHKGFIPWDDDIDLFMPADDFGKLCSIWSEKADTEHYSLCLETREYNDHHLTPTIRDNKTTFITEETCETDTNQGVALEIAVLNACPKSKIGQKVQLILAAGASLFKAQRLPKRQNKIVYFISKLLLGFFRGSNIRYFMWATMERWATKSNRQYQESEFVREFTMFPFIKWMYPRKWFDDTLWVPFENTKMPIPIGAHEYLTKRYGNYMELPPEKDRHPEHRIVFMDLDTPYIKYRGEKYYTKKK